MEQIMMLPLTLTGMSLVKKWVVLRKMSVILAILKLPMFLVLMLIPICTMSVVINVTPAMSVAHAGALSARVLAMMMESASTNNGDRRQALMVAIRLKCQMRMPLNTSVLSK